MGETMNSPKGSEIRFSGKSEHFPVTIHPNKTGNWSYATFICHIHLFMINMLLILSPTVMLVDVAFDIMNLY